MTVTTRSGSMSPVKKAHQAAINGQTADGNSIQAPLKHFILPQRISESARFLLLPHPRETKPQRFLFCPSNGLYHCTKVTSAFEPRSLLFAPRIEQVVPAESPDLETAAPPLSKGYISKSAEFYVATPFDLAFVLIALIVAESVSTEKVLFQPIDDLLEERTREDRDLKYLVENGRDMVQESMSRFCDTMEAGDELMLRPNEDKILRLILGKVQSTMETSLPATLEEQFVTRALEAPILSVRREETAVSVVKLKTRSVAPDEEGNEEEDLDVVDSQSSAASTAPSAVFSEVSTASSISTVVPETTSPQIVQLQKQRILLDFILTSYVSEGLSDRLRSRLLTKDSPIDFNPLEEHMSSLAALKAEALASRSIGDFSRKRGLEDDESAELRAEKKRKQEEDDRKKRLGESTGVRALKKVNVSGMKKMSDFFSKKPMGKAA
jgi:hypothetical protein